MSIVIKIFHSVERDGISRLRARGTFGRVMLCKHRWTLRRHSRRDRKLKTCLRHVFLTPRRIDCPSCAAAAHFLNGRHRSVVRRRNQRQRRWSRDDSMTKQEIFCERVAGQFLLVQRIARRSAKEPEILSGVFACFCHCWQKQAAPEGETLLMQNQTRYPLWFMLTKSPSATMM